MRYYLIFIFSFFILLCTSCKFDLFEDYSFVTPEISILGIETSQDTLFLVVSVADKGNPIDVIGFSYKIGEDPLITDNQEFYGGDSGEFLIPITGLKPNENYTFLAFAGNEYTLGYSEFVSFKMPKNFGFIAPCELEEDIFWVDDVAYPAIYSSRGYFLTAYTLSSSSSSYDMDIYFTEPPTKGIYKTSREGIRALSEGNVFIVLRINNQQSNIKNGAEIYVDINQSGKYVISFCELSWNFQSKDLKLKGLIKI